MNDRSRARPAPSLAATLDGLHTYSWDGYGRPVTIDSVNLTYDAFGRMVEQNRGGAYTQLLYSPTGLLMETGLTPNNGPYQQARVPLPGGAMAIWAGPGGATFFYRHGDWLGSSRFASTLSRTMYCDGAYAPFGEPYAQAGTRDLSFTGMNQDTAGGLYDFPAREYSIQGRWASPDPAGIAAVDPSNPQSWNRYAYVLNNPLKYIDPSGLDCIYYDDSDGYAAVQSGDCTNAGGNDNGVFVDGTVNNTSVDSNGNLTFGFTPTDCPSATICAGSGNAADFANWDWSSTNFNASNNSSVDLNNLPVLTGNGPVGIVGGNTTILDSRANALAHAINNTGVQSLGNPCTVGAFYAASALGGASGALAGGEAAATGSIIYEASAPYWPMVFTYAYRQSLTAFPVIRGLIWGYGKVANAVQGTRNAVQSACNTIQ